jgi:hypothetical protein
LIVVKSIFWSSANNQPKNSAQNASSFRTGASANQEKIMTILKTMLVAIALITSGAAFASEGGNDITSNTITESRVSFALKSTVNQPVDNAAQLQRGSSNRIFTNASAFPVNTTTNSQGSNN